MSLSYSIRGRHTDFETEQQFASALADIASEAASRALEIEETFSTFDKMASFAIERARGDDRMGPSWFGYEAGLAAGILGDMKLAEHFLRRITDDRVIPYAQRFLGVVGDRGDFTSKVNAAIAEQRTALKLEPLVRDAF